MILIGSLLTDLESGSAESAISIAANPVNEATAFELAVASSRAAETRNVSSALGKQEDALNAGHWSNRFLKDAEHSHTAGNIAPMGTI